MARSESKRKILLIISILASLFVSAICKEEAARIYMVLVSGSPVVHYKGSIEGYPATKSESPWKKINALSPHVEEYTSYLVRSHDALLADTFKQGKYKKLYSYHHLINGFSVLITPRQADLLQRRPEVLHVEEDTKVRTLTTHTPDYLGLPKGAWVQEGGAENAGEGVVIGIVDTGIDPTHSSFTDEPSKPFKKSESYTGKCEVATEFPEGSCTNKLVGAQHFAAAAVASGEFNASLHFASPLDGDGHGTHTAATAAGNSGVPVIVNGFNYGSASGMAPRAQIAAYKALYRYIGGFFSDVVAAIEQAAKDGVDVLSLSVGPNGLPRGNATFLSTFDLALLSAAKAGVFVVQAAGNAGPYARTTLSFSPWIFSVAASTHDRTYVNTLVLGINKTIAGIGLAPGTNGTSLYKMVWAKDIRLTNTSFNPEECQDASHYHADYVEGNILVCTYTLRFLFGASSIKRVVATAKTLNAAGIVLLTGQDVDGHTYQPTLLDIPAIIIPTLKDSLALMQYYNTTTAKNDDGKQIIFGAMGSISGGQQATYTSKPPQVATYSSRGPDVNNNNLDIADVLKPNILAPGSQIWAAWSSIGTDEHNFDGDKFAMISGTSMATPHVAGIGALVKQKFRKLTHAGIASALATTASPVDSSGNPILAQHPSSNVNVDVGQATAFDMGSGFINPAAALDPGLIFDAGYEDYVSFLCSIPGLSNSTIFKAIGEGCGSTIGLPSDLNTPYITIANLNGSRTVVRTVTNVATNTESYSITTQEPDGVAVSVNPKTFSVEAGESAKITITLNAKSTGTSPSFGDLVLLGSQGHKARIPLVVVKKAGSNLTRTSGYFASKSRLHNGRIMHMI